MIDVHLPTTGGRERLLSRYTEPEPELNLLLNKLKLELPEARRGGAYPSLAARAEELNRHSLDYQVAAIHWDLAFSKICRGSQVRTRLPAGGRWIRTSGSWSDLLRRDA